MDDAQESTSGARTQGSVYRSREGRNADVSTQMVLDLLYIYQKKIE